MLKVLLCVLFSLSFFGCGLFGSDNTREQDYEEDPRKKKCEYLDKAYSAFQSYLTCLETTPNEVLGGYSEITEQGSSTVKVACVDVFNQGYSNIPDDIKEGMSYFSSLHERLNDPPEVTEGPGVLEVLLFAVFKDEERECLIGKARGLNPENFENDQSIQPQNQEALINQRRAVFVRECRKEIGEKAYKDQKLEMYCGFF